MSKNPRPEEGGFAAEVFDIPGSDPALLTSGRIPDPQPEHTVLFQWLAEQLTTLEAFLRARGGKPLRVVIRLFWGLLAAIGLFLLVGPVINKPMDFDDVIAGSKIEDVDWAAQNASFDYDVSRADDGTFATTVREKFSAHFFNGPEPTIRRSIITEVHGHDTEFKLVSATIDGKSATVTEKHRATTTDVTLQLASGEQFSGVHDIELNYELHNLVKSAADQGDGATVDDWQWPIFAPSWTQATSGLEVSITLPRDIDDELVRAPYATLGWLLVSGSVWLTPDAETDEWVRYAFDNDDNLPPNSDVWIKFVFNAGTFEQPPKTTLFWVQTWGPLIPLALLAALMLFALAARKIVWADSAGKPWYLARSEPPSDLSPGLAADLLGKPRHAELVAALAGVDRASIGRGRKNPGKFRTLRWDDSSRDQADRATWLEQVARVGRRAGRIGSLPSVSAVVASWNLVEEPVGQKLRWKPDSYVRDTFIFAPLALSLIQFGILRQLSQQYILLIVWWPFAFVAASTIIAGIAIWAVYRPRPLTPTGARAVQQLKGINVWARGTRLLERGPVDDPLLPYAVLFEHPRRAGDAVADHAIREAGDRELTRGWSTEHFLSMPSILGFLAALVMLVGAILLPSTQPPPYAHGEFLTCPSSESSGAMWTQIEGFEIEAELQRDADGGAKLEVVERMSVGFEAGGGSVPQFEREWPRTRLGQDLGLEVSSIRIDGDEVPFDVADGQRTSKVTTRLTNVLEGDKQVEVRYTLTNPVVEAAGGKGTQQQMRWTAMLWFWDDLFYAEPSDTAKDRVNVRPIRVQLAIAPDLVGEVVSGGWIGHGDADSEPFEYGSGFTDWAHEGTMYIYPDEEKELGTAVLHDLRTGHETVREDGALVVTLDADAVESRTGEIYGEDGLIPPGEYTVDAELNSTLGQHELGLQGDFGVVVNFTDGTFTDVKPGAYQVYRMSYQTPLGAVIVLTLVGLVAAGASFVLSLTRRSGGASALLTAFGTVPLIAIVQTIVFWWVFGPMPGDDPKIPGFMIAGVLMWVVVIAQFFPAGLRASRSPKIHDLTRD